MNLKELDSFKISDAITFHDKLNPKLWAGNKLRPEVKNQLESIAEDFLQEMGIHDLDVRDITISGSNAAYSYNKHSDIDLHILVNMNDLPNSDIYKELFNAKKTIYNDSHDITIHGIPVELYVENAAEPAVTLGEYSIKNDKWLRIPTKRRANFDQKSTKLKYEKLLDIVKRALKSKDLDKIQKVLKKIKQYRQAGLDKGGEFGPENLAFKALRSQGWITKLYELRDKLHSEKLSIESMYASEDYNPNGPPPGPEFKPTMPKGTVKVDVSDVYDWYKLGQHISNMKGLGQHDFGQGPPSTILSFGDEDTEHQYIQDLEKTGLTTTDVDPPAHDKIKGQKTDPRFNVEEAKVPNIRQQIIDTVKKYGGDINDYFVRFTDTDKLGFSAKQGFGKTPDVDNPKFDVDYIGQGEGRRALWFYPLSYYLKDKRGVYASDNPYIWLVKLKPNAWMQTVKRGDNKVQQAPKGKERVGMLRMSDPPAAIFFTYGFDVVGRYYDYAGQHKRHGEVKGRPDPSFFDKIRGIDEDFTGQYASEKTPVISPYAGVKDNQYRGAISENSTSTFVYHVTPTKNIKSIAKQGLTPTVGDRASQIAGEKSGIYVFPDKVSAEDAVMNWLGDEFDDEPLTMLKIDISGLENNITKGADYELIVGTTIEPKRIKKVNIQLEEASGYIPSEKEKNDPRFKTALTVDIKPYTMKKDAKKFGNTISRAGIPPTLKPSGKF
jgi:hypothetical protein